MDSWIYDLLISIDSTSTPSDIFFELEKRALKLDFDYCAYGFRHSISFTKPRTTIINNYPPAWRVRYEKLGYASIDPTVLRAQKSQSPFTWGELPLDDARPFWDEAKSYGLVVGWAKSTLDVGGGGMLTLARSNENLSAKELEAKGLRMRLLADFAHTALSNVYRKDIAASVERLSLREIEVLRWHADGKTAEEIGRILSISIDTVKYHTKNAIIKLGASNKTAAVARAAIMGLLI